MNTIKPQFNKTHKSAIKNKLGNEIKYFTQDDLLRGLDKTCDSGQLTYATDALRNDINVMIYILSLSDCSSSIGMGYASKKILANKIIASLAIESSDNLAYFTDLHKSLLSDKELMLQYVIDKLRNDKDIILKAVASRDFYLIKASIPAKFLKTWMFLRLTLKTIHMERRICSLIL